MTRGELELVMNCMAQILAVLKREAHSIMDASDAQAATEIAPVPYDWTDAAAKILSMTMDSAEAGMKDEDLIRQIATYLSGIAPHGTPIGD